MGLDIRIDPGSSLPLSAQISEQLRWLILGGVLSDGDALPPAVDLARQLNVNFHTVRAAYQQLADQSLVSLGRGRRTMVRAGEGRQRVWPEPVVPSHSIGVLIPEFVQHYARLIAGIESEAALQPTLVYVANAHETPNTALRYLDRFFAKGVDGIIIAASLLDPDMDLPGSGPPIVFVDSPGAPPPSVEFDLRKAQYLATRHLIEHGHRRLGYITPPVHLANVAPKLAGHKEALDEAGQEYDPRLTVQTDDFTTASGKVAALELLDRERPPTALAISSDGLAFGAYAAARQLGRSIPDDVAVASNDDTDTSALVHPSLTTTTLPLLEAGRIAVRQLQELKNGMSPEATTILDIDLVQRHSCGHHPAN